MPNIRIMDEALANQIAAGEVVERPASVVKELVENALDANARTIDIDIVESGLRRIRVSDDGVGMDAEDATLCFERHATSKLQHPRDLFRIRSLGFRGEALPSIAAVSNVELITRAEACEAGVHVWVKNGTIVRKEPVARNVGTDVIVEDLFYNTPARLKYVKSLQTEFHHISDYVMRMAILRSDVRFRLTHDGKRVFQTLGDGQQTHVMAAVYGTETAKRMIPLKWKNHDYTITGCISAPEINRSSRSHMILFVNGRYIRNYAILNGILRAYHTRLPIHRYPITAISIEMDPVLVDPNVHPNKIEVRFSEEQEVVEAVVQAVKEALAQQVLIPSVNFAKAVPTQAASEERKPATAEKRVVDPPKLRSEQQAWSNRDFYASFQSGLPKEAIDTLYQPPSIIRESATARMVEEPPVEEDPDASRSVPNVPRLRAVAQVLGMYVIAQDEDAMYIIDQHAAHERVLYETFTKRWRDRGVRKLPLLVPYSFELPAQDLLLLEERKEQLDQMGIEVESFGGHSLLVRTVPDIWEGLETQRLVKETIEDWIKGGYYKQPLERIEERIIMKACKAAIKANRWLSMPEMQALCDQLCALENPFSCPHGRPVIIKFSAQDLEKQFKRIQ
jgi:DNA mismatch repair protein MutL